ncbi:hypothetical protein JYT89_02080, partial [Flavobacteriaceae bacterium AH-315-B10]|nr:hypothetical protein [Flavobacteriaceae bacterium AH-315-B10]
NLTMLVRKDIKSIIKKHNPKELSLIQKKTIKTYFKERGYKNIKTYWHQFYIANNGYFSEKYISEDIFHPIISNAVNQKKQWPTLLDKNLLETLFFGSKQPESIIKNINGFYYINSNQVNKFEAIDECSKYTDKFVIKPSIESGGGREIISFSIENGITTFKGMHIEDLLNMYKKDFIIQKVVSQHPKLKKLNSSSLNTLRIMTYLKEKEVHILSAIIRIGKSGMFTDNSSLGGIVCGINKDGNLKEYGYFSSGKRIKTTESNVNLIDCFIPSYSKALEMVKDMHFKIPYFRIVSWDIGIDDENDPVLIEYNTYRQGIGIHQLTNGPLFGKFTEELLEIGRNYKLKL